MTQRSRLRSVVFSVLVVAMSLLFCLAIFEFVLGALVLDELDPRVDTRFDSELGWTYVSGAYKVRADDSLVSHEIRINEMGLRTTASGGSSGNAGIRIVVLGDSFTFAKVVSDDDVYTQQLEDLMNEGSTARVEVVNAGIEGFGNAQQLHMLRRLTESGIRADVVVLQLFTNDILDNLRLGYRHKSESLARPGYVLDERGHLRLDHLPVDPAKGTGRKRTRSSLHTVRIIRTLVETSLQSYPQIIGILDTVGLRPEVPRMPGVLNAWYDEEIIASGVPLMRSLIREIKSEVASRNAKFLLMFVPSPFMIYPETYGPLLSASFPDDPSVDSFLADPGRPNRYFLEICRDLSLDCVDLYPVLSQRNADALYFPREGHFTPAGHSLVAHALAARIRQAASQSATSTAVR